MKTNLLLFAFLLVFGTIEAHPSQGQRFARQAEEEEDSTEKMMLDNFDDVANNEVENPEIVKEMSEEYDTEVEVKIKTNMNDEMVKDEMMKDEMSEVEDENEVKVEAPVVKAPISTSTTTTKATPSVAPLGVTLRTVTTRRVTTTRRPVRVQATQATTTQAPSDPGLLGRLGNFINSGVGNIGSSFGGGLISGGSLLAAAASPLWAPLLVGKKRRKRSEDVSLNEIDQARSMQYYSKLIMSHIKQAGKNYY